MSAVLCACGRLTEAGRTVAHDRDCRPGVVCGTRCESVCGRCAHDIRATGWADDTLGSLRATTAVPA